MLFNLITDVLNKILGRAQRAGLLQGLGNYTNCANVLNLHFADDTLLFLKADKKMIVVLRWLLLGFENLSGMKINFDKSEMVPLNISEEDGQELARLLGCKVVKLPIMYLGVPLHWRKLSESDWLPLIEKLEKRLQSWKGKLMSLGKKSYFVKCCCFNNPFILVVSL